MFTLIATSNLSHWVQRKEIIHVYFSDVQGLKKDNPVQIMGLESGRVLDISVTSMTAEDGQKIPAVEVVAKVVYPEAFSKDTKISVDKSLTGSTVLKIVPGRAPEKFASNDKIHGIAPVSMTELANKAGLVANRVDEFVADLTDKNITGAIRAAMINVKTITDDLKSVSASLSHSLPLAEKSLVDGLKNIKEVSGALNESVVGNKEKISDLIQNVHSSSESLARIGKTVDKLVEGGAPKLSSAMSNVDKTSANLKAVSREIRWQPWLLLKKPEDIEVKERSVYNTALEFSEGAETLSQAVRDMVALSNSPSRSPAQEDHLKRLKGQIDELLQKSTDLQRRVWVDLTTMGKDKR